MLKKSFSLWFFVFSLLVFLIALLTYALTMEPSVSWWDCGEFIASAYKLEVGHPPGAPLFMMIGRVFSLVASDPSQVAKMVNMVSVLSSALTTLFLFWTIRMLVEKVIRVAIVSTHHMRAYHRPITMIISAAVGALAYAFSDTFWFSAVEGEVYALSSLFTAVVFWAILRWEREVGQPGHLRWILLIAYLVGLSIGVHLLNLLAIPAIVMIWYFKSYPKATIKGISKSLGLSVLILAFMMYLLIPGIATIASWFELFFINLADLPFNSGLFIFVVVLAGSLTAGIWYTHSNQKLLWNTLLLGISMILIGYSSYTLILIRSAANPPMDQNNPEHAFNLVKYLNRDQYGNNPLIYGNYYSAPILDQKLGKGVYGRMDGKYEIIDREVKRVYDKRFLTLFPRMWHNSPDHVQGYEEWGQVKGKTIPVTQPNGQQTHVIKPTFVGNVRYFFSYQLGHMYYRYFMWNFVGRQDDVQGHGGIAHGNWISGIGFLDSGRLGSQENIPSSDKENPGRNAYFFLPFLLGLFGAIWQYRRCQKDFWVVMLLFIMTGIAIVLYLNQYPNQPRERDYSFAGSFYAFSIWIGLGAAGLPHAIGSLLSKRKNTRIPMVVVILLLGIPLLMAGQNWNDHNRSGRTIARDFAYNYLNSCAPNAILFTNGDNDTFPLWYLQEVEGVRTDVRVICLPYLITDWYIEQMKRRAYLSEPVPFNLTWEQYRPGVRDMIPVIEQVPDTIDIRGVMNFILSEDEKAKWQLQEGYSINYLPVKNLGIWVDRDQVLQNGVVEGDEAELIVPSINFKITRGTLYKNDLMILDLLASNTWERPIYFTSINHSNILGLKRFFRLEGFAYRFVPVENPDPTAFKPQMAPDQLYQLYMNDFRWGGMGEDGFHADFYTQQTAQILRIRQNFSELADRLIDSGEREKAVEVLDRIMDIMPAGQFGYDLFIPGIAESYYRAANSAKANYLLRSYADHLFQELNHYLSLQNRYQGALINDAERNAGIIQEIIRLAEGYQEQDLKDELEMKFNRLLDLER